ncbi:MAG: GWxTD domain-containing protein, partial [Acidobacteriota bacterium]
MSILLFFVLGSFLAPQGEEKENYYQKWLEEDVIYIITEEEKSVFLKLTTAEERDRFIEQFWRRRDPDPKTIANEFKEEHYRRVAYANDHFGAGLPGWQTDRGRYYIKYGPPDDIESRAGGSTYQRPNSEGGGLTTVYPFEVWYYRHLEGIGQNIEIEFVDRHGGGLYTVARDEMEKDALLYVPGLGLTQAESLGLTSKAKRLQQRYYGDLEQKYRGQFYVPEYDNQPFEKLLQKSLLQKPPQIRYKDLQALVSTRIHYNQVPLEVAVHLLRVAGDLSLIPVTLQLPPADLRIYGRVENLTHRIIYEFEDQVEVDPQAEQEIVYQKSIPIQGPGRFKLTMVAEDTQNKRVGMVEKAFLVPEFSSEELSLSSLILADKIRLADAERRYTLSGYEIYPNVDGEFPHKGYFGIYLEAYNAALDSQRNEPVIEVDFVIRSDGRVIDSSPQALPQSETTIRNLGNRIVITKLFSLRHLAPGHYQFIARVQDKVSGERKERRTEFKVGGPLMQQLQQARQYHEQGEYGLAAEAYRKAIKLDPHNGEAYN